MKIGIIAAMPEEFRAVAAGLGIASTGQPGLFRVEYGNSAGHEFLLVESGIGFDNAARAAEVLIREGYSDLLISIGFCGGILSEQLAGDVIVAEQIVIVDENGIEEVPVRLSDTGKNFVVLQASGRIRVVGGTLVSSPMRMSKIKLAEMLPVHYSNPVVEMESGAIAIIAAENNVPVLAIRSVSDIAAEELEFSPEELCNPDMRRIRLYKVLLTVLRKPHIIPQLIRLSRSSRKAADSLRSVVPRLLSLFQNSSRR
jgi:adenosylhomocysteine nucleosidase